MSAHQADIQIDRIARAIDSGDLVEADSALQALRPLLVSDRVDELLALKEKVDSMTLVVRRHRSKHSEALKNMLSQRNAIGQYREMDELPHYRQR
jgi:hypothetical protein